MVLAPLCLKCKLIHSSLVYNIAVETILPHHEAVNSLMKDGSLTRRF